MNDLIWLQLNKKYDRLKEPRRTLVFFLIILPGILTLQLMSWGVFAVVAGIFICNRIYYFSGRWKKNVMSRGSK